MKRTATDKTQHEADDTPRAQTAHGGGKTQERLANATAHAAATSESTRRQASTERRGVVQKQETARNNDRQARTGSPSSKQP